jgi:hypothetical protein
MTEKCFSSSGTNYNKEIFIENDLGVVEEGNQVHQSNTDISNDDESPI